MKKKKLFSKVVAIVLVLSLMLTTFPSFSAFAQEASSKEQLTEKGELWQPESNPNELNFEGDLSIEELQSAKLNDEDTPEIVGQDNIEEKGHVNRLWEQEEDLNSIVFQNRDGTKTMYYYNYPVKYKDANGKIKDKSNKITQTSSGDYTNAENDINTYFPKKLNRNKGIELKFGEYVVEMAPDIQGNSGASRQTGHNKYFEPTEYVQYPNVFDESISLRYTPTFEGYKEDIVLSKYTGINEFSFRLYTDGLSLVMNEDGVYCLIDPLSGEVKTQIGDLVVYDSKPFDVPDEILNESVSNPTEEDYAKKEAILKATEKNVAKESSSVPKTYLHQYKVKTVKQDNEYLITIIVDEDYLTDKERVYPVYVDPTLRIDSFAANETKNIMDAPIYSARPNNTHSNNEINVVGYAGYWNGVSHGVGRTLMKFPGLSEDSTYKNLRSDQITSLQLHIYEGSGNTETSCIDLWQYTGTSWTESTARCNNIGWDSYTNNFTWNYINSSGWQVFDLTSMVETWKGSSTALDKGIMLKNYTSESTSGYSKHFMSTESGYKPYLTYTYATFVPPTGPTTGITDGAIYRIKNTFSSCNMGLLNNTTAKQYLDNERDATQLWEICYQGNGYYKLKSAIMPNEVLTLNYNGVVLSEDCGLQSQLWAIKQISTDQYLIINKNDITNCLQIVGNSSSTGQSIISSNGDISNKWQFEELLYKKWRSSNHERGSYVPENGVFIAKFYQENNKWKFKTTVFFQLDQYNVNAIKDYMNHTDNFITRHEKAKDFDGDTCWGLDVSLQRTDGGVFSDTDDFNAISVATNLPNFKTDIESNSGNYNDETDVVAKSLPAAQSNYWFESVWEDMRNGATNDAGAVVVSFDISGDGYKAPWPLPDHDDYNYICGSDNVVTFDYGTNVGH